MMASAKRPHRPKRGLPRNTAEKKIICVYIIECREECYYKKGCRKLFGFGYNFEALEVVPAK